MVSTFALLRECSRLQITRATLFLLGLFCFKFAAESSSLTPLATSKFDQAGRQEQKAPQSFNGIGVLQLISLTFSILGSSLVATLVKRWRLRFILTFCAFFKMLTMAGFLGVELGTGGYLKPSSWDLIHAPNDYGYYGDYNPFLLAPIYAFVGLFAGMVGIMQKTVPRQIVGSEVAKLQLFNAAEQIFYEIAGISGALCSAFIFISLFGAHLPIFSLVFAALAGIAWVFIKDPQDEQKELPRQNKSTREKRAVWGDFVPLKSLWQGCKIVCGRRDLIWLLVAYPLTQYSHLLLEEGIATVIGQRYLKGASYSQIIVAGSNIGELCGAIVAMVLQQYVPSPLPWVRLNAVMLMLIWVFPFRYPKTLGLDSALIAAGAFLPMGATWSIADVSLYTYMQALLPDEAPISSRTLPPLSCAMAFLFFLQLIIVAICIPLLGHYVDVEYESTGGLSRGGVVQPAMVYVGGVQLSVVAVLIFASTFLPQGALSLRGKAVIPTVDEEQPQGSDSFPAFQKHTDSPHDVPQGPSKTPPESLMEYSSKASEKLDQDDVEDHLDWPKHKI